MPRRAGRHFLQIPGPTNVPDRVLRAIDFPTIDHRGPEFATLGKSVLAGLKRVFKSAQGEVVIYPASGTGAWEAALVNTLSPGDRCGRPPRALDGRHHLLARLDGLPARRMGRRRHGRRLAEGPDAAAGPVVQLRLAEGIGSDQVRAPAAKLLGLGRDARQRQE